MKKRVSFSDVFKYVAAERSYIQTGDAVVLANADILFDDSMSKIVDGTLKVCFAICVFLRSLVLTKERQLVGRGFLFCTPEVGSHECWAPDCTIERAKKTGKRALDLEPKD